MTTPDRKEFSLTKQQADILDHTIHRAAGGLYCGGGNEMNALVASGLMQSAGRKSFVPDEYFSITRKGREALQAYNDELKTTRALSLVSDETLPGGTVID